MYAISQGADVINVSLGMYTPGIVKTMSEAQQLNYISSSMKQEELMWSKIFEKAKQKNSIIVFAAEFAFLHYPIPLFQRLIS